MPTALTTPFVLLDDARPGGARPARLYTAPVETVVARSAAAVGPALARLETLRQTGLHLAGMLAYEAGLALEDRLAPLAAERSGADGPLLWFGAFSGFETIAAEAVPGWLTAQAADNPAATSIGPLDPQLSCGGYARAFAAIQDAIRAGDIYQANLTFRLSGAWRGDPLALYAALRPAAAAGYGGIVFDGSQWLLSCSPELFYAARAGEALVKPMKGTRPRSGDPAEDAALRTELADSVKDRAENLMIVDLLRNDLSRVAVPGTVRVDRPFAVESYPTVHQMTTAVRARLEPGRTATDLIRALFPCGSITGAPKIRAMELIGAVERDPRGPYCGAIGRIDPVESHGGGDSAFNVAIRTLRLSPDGNGGQGKAVLGLGSAVVADSQALPEWRECLIKGGFVRQAAGGFDLVETMAFTPEGGIALLELHLERIRASAAELGHAFDRHAVRNAIQALCFEATDPAKVRLVVARSGAYTLEITDMPAARCDGLRCVALPIPVDSGDWRLRHKTNDREFYAAGLAVAAEHGADEALFVRDDGLITEGCWTSVFVERDGILLTPRAALGLLPGVLRRSLLDRGRAREADLTLADLVKPDRTAGFLLGNAVRGLMPAQLA